MQGLLSDVPFIGILSLIHDTAHSGILNVEADIPFQLLFDGGEVIGGGILDWHGLDAVQSCPMLSTEGSFTFVCQELSGQPLMPYDSFSTEWAKTSDEWQQSLRLIGSPSAILQGPMLPIFSQPAGCSVRAAAAFAGMPLAAMAARAADGLREGKLQHTGRYAWFDVVLPAAPTPYTQLATQLDGAHSLGEIITQGLPIAQVRSDLIYEIRLGLRFEGCGWVLRDLLWEMEYSPS